MSELQAYQTWQIPTIWQTVAPIIQKAIDSYTGNDGYKAEDIYRALLTEEMQLWVSVNDRIEAALITSIRVENEVQYLLFVALGGHNMGDWKGFLPVIENWAREKGCTELRAKGRIGLARVFDLNIDYTSMSRML